MVALLRDWVRCAHEDGDCRNTPESMVAMLEAIDRICGSPARTARGSS